MEKYSPSIKWQIDTLTRMLCLAGNYVTDDTIASLINLIVATEELHLYSVIRLYNAMRNNLNQEGLVKVGIYVIGELGHLLLNNTNPDIESVSEAELLLLIDSVNTRKNSASIKEYLVNCYMKLINKLSNDSKVKLRFLLEQESYSYHCEVQNRAVEYLILANAAEDLKEVILKNIPNSQIVKESEVKK